MRGYGAGYGTGRRGALLPPPPHGSRYIADEDGNPLADADGSYLLEEIS